MNREPIEAYELTSS
jgi:hypothetical protein